MNGVGNTFDNVKKIYDKIFDNVLFIVSTHGKKILQQNRSCVHVADGSSVGL